MGRRDATDGTQAYTQRRKTGRENRQRKRKGNMTHEHKNLQPSMCIISQGMMHGSWWKNLAYLGDWYLQQFTVYSSIWIWSKTSGYSAFKYFSGRLLSLGWGMPSNYTVDHLKLLNVLIWCEWWPPQCDNYRGGVPPSENIFVCVQTRKQTRLILICHQVTHWINSNQRQLMWTVLISESKCL